MSFLINPYRFGVAAYDTDAQTYITAVEAADGQALETGVKDAINTFVVGCKADSIWTPIKACCILSGARTLSGALVPLVGTAPTNNNFVSGDYNRETGLVGNASTKYLNSNRNCNADGQNDSHLSVYVSSLGATVGTAFISAGAGNSSIGATGLYRSGNSRSRNATGDLGGATPTGFSGISRSSSTGYTRRASGTDTSITRASQTPFISNFFIFGDNNSTNLVIASDGRLAFYSIGTAITLASLDSRVSTLISDIAAAIP